MEALPRRKRAAKIAAGGGLGKWAETIVPSTGKTLRPGLSRKTAEPSVELTGGVAKAKGCKPIMEARWATYEAGSSSCAIPPGQPPPCLALADVSAALWPSG